MVANSTGKVHPVSIQHHHPRLRSLGHCGIDKYTQEQGLQGMVDHGDSRTRKHCITRDRRCPEERDVIHIEAEYLY